MKKTMIIIATLLMMTATIFAQTSAVTATVIQTALSIANDADVVIGDVAKGVNAVVDPLTDGSSSGGSVLTVGKISISGEEGFAIAVTPPTSATLSNGTGTMNFVPSVVGTTVNAQPASTDTPDALTNNTANTLSLSGTLGNGGTGDYYLWVGGTLTVGSTQSPGAYTSASGAGSSPLTFTIAYN